MIHGVARWPLTHIQPQKFFELFFHRHGFKRAGCTCAVDNACGWALLYKQISAWICIDICIYYIHVVSFFGGASMCVCIYIYTHSVSKQNRGETHQQLLPFQALIGTLQTLLKHEIFFQIGIPSFRMVPLKHSLLFCKKLSQNFIGFPSISQKQM